jgi:hypothetical protein
VGEEVVELAVELGGIAIGNRTGCGDRPFIGDIDTSSPSRRWGDTARRFDEVG